MELLETRRDFLRASAVVGTGLVFSSCAGSKTNTSGKEVTSPTPDENRTDYVISLTQGAKLGASNGPQLAKALEGFVLMYRNHAAREETIVFPAWKNTMTGKQLDEMNDNLRTSSTSSLERKDSKTP